MFFHMDDGHPVVAKIKGAQLVGKIVVHYEGSGVSCLEYVPTEKQLTPEFYCTGCTKILSYREVGLFCTECGRLINLENMLKPELPGTFVCNECVKTDPIAYKKARKITELLEKFSFTPMVRR